MSKSGRPWEGTLSRRAAPEKLFASTTRANTAMHIKSSIAVPIVSYEATVYVVRTGLSTGWVARMIIHNC
jgi:hypothetical protein